jgi:hypothetical protein
MTEPLFKVVKEGRISEKIRHLQDQLRMPFRVGPVWCQDLNVNEDLKLAIELGILLTYQYKAFRKKTSKGKQCVTHVLVFNKDN